METEATILKEFLGIKNLKEIKLFKGMVYVTDSYRALGGYFRYKDTDYFGYFFIYQNEIYHCKSGKIQKIVSRRKKNFRIKYKEVVNIHNFKLE